MFSIHIIIYIHNIKLQKDRFIFIKKMWSHIKETFRHLFVNYINKDMIKDEKIYSWFSMCSFYDLLNVCLS